MSINIIVARDLNKCIGGDNKLLWSLREDMLNFKKMTIGSTIIMGRKTFDSIGGELPNRTNIVITRNKAFSHKGILVVNSMSEAIMKSYKNKDIFIIGGSEIYKLALSMLVDNIYLTEVECEVKGDVYFDFDEKKFYIISEKIFNKSESNDYNFKIIHYKKRAN